jgi:hypothetical protein
MRRWIGGVLTFLGFLGVAPIAWGVTAAFFQSISPESAVSPGVRLSLGALAVAGFILTGYIILRVAKDR